MAPPQLTEDEIDDLLYFARTGDQEELASTLTALAEREKVSTAEILSSARDDKKSTCLHMATGNGHLETIKYILTQFQNRPKPEKQAFLDAGNEFGNTGLHWASLGGFLEVVKFLMAEGASPALANDKNYVPLDLASFGEKFDVVDYFLAQSGGLEEENSAEGLKSAAQGVSLDGGKGKEGEDEEEDVNFTLRAGDTTGGEGSSSK
ncbi:Ankyrin repeat-containing domain protein [Rhypophila decipiens]